MKPFKVLFTLLFTLGTALPSSATESDNSIGLSYSVTAQPYQGIGNSGTLTPSINVDWGKFYWHGDDGGYRLYDREKNGFTLYGKWRPFAYQASQSPLLTGMSERTAGIDVGLMAHHINPDMGLFRLIWLQDPFDLHNGSELRAEYGIGTQTAQYGLLLLLGLYQRDQAYHQYYYGISSAEARPNRPAYSATTASSYDLALYARYNLNQDWQISSKLLYDRLPATVQNSPIIDKTAVISGSLSLSYRF